jgi:hypothetical protein
MNGVIFFEINLDAFALQVIVVGIKSTWYCIHLQKRIFDAKRRHFYF